MPNRILREGILTSERIEKLNWAEEVFYRRLMSVVDDFGRYYARPALLLAACYPLLLKKVSDSDIEKWLSACENAALVRVYPALDGKRYLQLLDFKQQVRATNSKYPPPPSVCEADAQQVHSKQSADAHLDVSGDGVVSEVDFSSPPAPPPGPAAPTPSPSPAPALPTDPKGSRLPADWSLPPEWAAWCEETRPDLDPRVVGDGFKDFWIGKPGKDGRKADWLATWRNWCRGQKPGTRQHGQRMERIV